MPLMRNRQVVKFLRRKGELKLQAKKLSDVKLGKSGKQIPPADALQIRTAVERILAEDPHSLVFAIGGVARTYKGEQAAFKDIDLAVVTSKGNVYKNLSSTKFKREVEALAGREVDVFPFKRQHFKRDRAVLNHLSTESKIGLYPVYSLAEGIPLYNIERARKFQQRLENLLKVAYDKKDREEIKNNEVNRSMKRRLLKR